MWSNLKKLFNSIPRIPISKRNQLFIVADIKKGTVIVSYKRKVAKGNFNDKTLPNMIKGVRFEKNAAEFFMATADLISKVTE